MLVKCGIHYSLGNLNEAVFSNVHLIINVDGDRVPSLIWFSCFSKFIVHDLHYSYSSIDQHISVG